MSSEWFIGFVDGVIPHTCNMDSPAWVIYAPLGQLVASGGTYLGLATTNVVEYSVVIKLLCNTTLRGTTCVEVSLDSQLVVSQLNGDYQV